MKILTLIIILFFSILTKCQNLAYHKKYTFSVPPNYPHSAPSNDKTSLTDGFYTNANFWTNTSTVGWQSHSITINIDLDSIRSVGSIWFNTIRNENVGINYPQNIFVFLSKDNIKFNYVGDAADNDKNIPGNYEIRKFILNDINEPARYISIVVIPNGAFVFCDEIEVLKSISNYTGNRKIILKEHLKQAIDSITEQNFARLNLIKIVDKLNYYSFSKSSRNKSFLTKCYTQLNDPKTSLEIINNIKNHVFKNFASNLRDRYNESFIVERINPWESISELHKPNIDSDLIEYSFIIPTNFVDYGSFIITNISALTKYFSFKILDSDNTISIFELYNVPFISTSKYVRCPDPLVKIKEGIRIPPGITEMFIFRIAGQKTGNCQHKIAISDGNEIKKIKINTSVIKYDVLSPSEELNVNVWAYLNYPLLSDRRKAASENLEWNRINTIVIPPSVIPNITSSDFNALKNYLLPFKNIRNILLFTNYATPSLRNGYNGGQFLSLEWQKYFIQWYRAINQTISDMGFKNSTIYIYPYDEIGPQDVSDLKDLVKWAKSSIKDIKFYATLGNDLVIDTLLPIIDIAQIHYTSNKLKNLPIHKSEVWIYKSTGQARSLAPYSYYRLMAWEAFIYDYKGIGFWSYADEGSEKKENNITGVTLNFFNSYSVIYTNLQNEIISSRRLEAFHQGVEDYSILTLYTKKMGKLKARDLAIQVLKSQKNLNVADSIRNIMLNTLKL